VPGYNRFQTVASEIRALPASGATIVVTVASDLERFDRVLVALYDYAGTGGPGINAFAYQVSSYLPSDPYDSTEIRGWIDVSQTWDPAAVTTGRGSFTSFEGSGYHALRVTASLSGSTSLDGTVRVDVIGYMERQND